MSERYIYLKNADGILKQEMFRYESHRLKIVEKWKKLYGRKFSELTIEEEPEVKKEKPGRPKAGKVAYGTILVNRNRGAIRKNFNRNFNGYKD